MQTYLFPALLVLLFSQGAPANDPKPEMDKKEEASPSESKTPESLPNANSYTGEIFIIRNGAKTEVFFRNHNQSYFIPKDNKHNTRLKELQRKSKLNQPVTVEFNAKTREITEIKGPPPAAPSLLAPKAEPSENSSSK